MTDAVRLILRLCVLWFGLIGCCVGCAQATLTQQIAEGIHQIVADAGEDLNLGITVQAMRDGRVLYARHNTRLYNPASTLKLYTAATALRVLGYDYRFSTVLSATAWPAQHGLLNGDVYLTFSGDPSLQEADLQQLVMHLARAGVRKISGHVYLDTTATAVPQLGPGWMWDDATECYSTPAWAGNLEHNCVSIRLVPRGREGYAVQTTPTGLIAVDNASVQAPLFFAPQPLHVQVDARQHYVVQGTLLGPRVPHTVDIAIQQLPGFLLQRVQRALQLQGIVYHDTVAFKAISAHGIRVAQHDSAPLWQLITHMLAVSDNLYAETLRQRVALASTKGAVSALDGFAQATVSAAYPLAAPVQIVDGSGLSRYNQVSPDFLAAVLRDLYVNLPLSAYLLPALGNPRWNAWLTPSLSLVRAKTGSMTGVVGLSGFVRNPQRGDLAFVFLLDGFSGDLDKYRLLLQRMALFLATV